MQAIRMHETGGPNVLMLEETATATPNGGEVLIKVAAAGINYADLLQRQGVYPRAGGMPAILGFEVAGTVATLGPDVDGPAPGTRVVAGLGGGGGYAEYAVAPAATVFPIPDNVGFASATALFVQGLTAFGLLDDAAKLREGESVLVHAAAGGVGSLAVQLAKLLGAGTVIGTASSAEKLDLVRRLGADVAINYTDLNWSEQVNEATGGLGASIILDAVGGEIGQQSLDHLAVQGRLVVYGASSGQPVMFAAQQLVGKNQAVIGYSIGGAMSPEQRAEAMRALLGFVAEDRLHIVVGQTFPLRDASHAHRAMAERRTTGKVVLLV
jgi:NADPH2:quinone reductase